MLEPINVLLLVEDDDNDVIITKRKIARSSVQINHLLITRTFEETKKLLAERNDVDVILLDLNLPDSSGLDTLDKVRAIYDGTLIVLTSIDDELVGIEAIRKGADEYLVKSQLSEKLLTHSIYHAIVRHTRWENVKKAHQTLEKLDDIKIK